VSNIKLVKTGKEFGHYSQATLHNDIVYVAGTLGVFPDDVSYIGTIEEQAEQCLKNIQAILETAGSDLQHLLTVTIFVLDMGVAPKINEIYARLLGEHKPARAMIGVAALPRGFHVEIMATAAIK
jgi:2-iminobutanoate/2-iminopropanoate deaminase